MTWLPEPASPVVDPSLSRRRVLHRLASAPWLVAAGTGGAGLAVSPISARAQGGRDLYGWAPEASVPKGYPASYLQIIRAAEAEGRLTVYSNTDAEVAEPLVNDFRSMYPRITVDFEDQTATELNYRFIAETQLGRTGADVVWSSAMDQQVALIDRGDAMAYDTPEAAGLPSWARLGDRGWATTLEPIGFVYDQRRLKGDEVPRTHDALRLMLERDPARFDRRVTLYDVMKSGVGYLLATQDVAASSESAYRALIEAIGRCRPRLVLTVSAMLRAVESGDATIAYNAIGDYALARAARSPSLGVVFPTDYTLVLSRVLFISRSAPHPNAARLWVDYLLSPRGQQRIADGAGLHPIRDGITSVRSAAALRERLGPSMRPIPLDPRLALDLETDRYTRFIAAWRDAIGRPVGPRGDATPAARSWG